MKHRINSPAMLSFRSSSIAVVGALLLLPHFAQGDESTDEPVKAMRLDSETALSRILFGSCIKQEQPAPVFQTMLDERAQLVLMTGDNIYADTDDMTVMRKKYAALSQIAGFARLRKTTPMLATWDDHDYGVNDGGADYPKREQAQVEFLDFWGVPKQSTRRDQNGVYDSVVIGPVGKRVQILMLDTRYFRSPLKKGTRRVGGPYYPDPSPNKTMLGDEQWHWLRQQLEQDAEIRLIVSSIQFVAQPSGQECWGNLPLEQSRLINLIKETKAEGVVFLSGDRHWSEFSEHRVSDLYPIYDFTCSSLNQLHPRGTPTENRFRSVAQTYHRENYGVIEIDWDGEVPQILVSIKDLTGTPQIQQRLRLDKLTFPRDANDR